MDNDKEKMSSLPEFETPPINEVVAGVFFDPLQGFRLPHFGLFWGKIKDQYPYCEHASRLIRGPVDNKPSSFFLPRVWLFNQERTSLIQMQDDCFLFNWRRVTGDEAYPRYTKVVGELWNRLSEYRGFLEDQSLPTPTILQCELSYINHIPAGEIWQTPVEIRNFAPDLVWREQKRFLPDFESSAWTGIFPLPEDFGKLTVSVRHGKKHTDGTPLYTIEFTARGLGGDGSNARINEWFNLAHEWIVQGFCDFTDVKIQKDKWRKKK